MGEDGLEGSESMEMEPKSLSEATKNDSEGKGKGSDESIEVISRTYWLLQRKLCVSDTTPLLRKPCLAAINTRERFPMNNLQSQHLLPRGYQLPFSQCIVIPTTSQRCSSILLCIIIHASF
jgi:hypothetical protein